MLCPFCGAINIEGADECEACGQALVLEPIPTNSVEEALITATILDIGSREPITASATTSVDEVQQLLVENSVGCVVIVDGGGCPIGIFSERDAIMKFNGDVDAYLNQPVSEVMSANPQVVRYESKVARAIHLMDLGHYRHLPVVDHEGVLVGIISVRDILKYLTEKIVA
ncbi:MAG: CBS domain-containing protein [Pirellulaceae bacterium]